MSGSLTFELNGQKSSHATHAFQQQQSTSPGCSRNTSLGPEAALLPGQIDWTQTRFQGHRRTPSDYSDISSVAPSPSLTARDAFAHSEHDHLPPERPQSDFHDGVMALGTFSISHPDQLRNDNTIKAQDDVLHPTQSQSPQGYSLQEDGTTKSERDKAACFSMASRRQISMSSGPNNVIALRLADPEYRSVDQNTKRRQKHPAMFQCTLCPKRFTRAYNLRSHLRTHTDERPFVCGICGKAFARLHDRKLHEGVHTQEKKFVCRGDLSNGNLWGCGRRFARADALGRHFRSEAGYICLKPVWDKERSQRNLEGEVQEPPADLDSYPPRSDVFALPASVIAQYPALARINRQEGASSGLEDNLSAYTSLDSSSHDSGYISDPARESTLGLPRVYQFSRTLDNPTATEFATQFARCLASKCGAHTWGKLVLARLGFKNLIFRLDAVLTSYLLTSHASSCVPVKEAINQTRQEIWLRFYAETQVGHSNPEALPTIVEAMESPAKQNDASSGGFSRMSGPMDEDHNLYRLLNLVETTDRLVFNTSFESLSLLVREKLYSTPRYSMDHTVEILRGAGIHKLSAKHSLHAMAATVPSESIEFSVKTHLTLFDYIKQNFSNEQVEVSTLVTITGTAFYAYATTCLDYMNLTWPDTGEILLPILQEAIQKVIHQPNSTARISKERDQLSALTIELCGDGSLNVRAKGSETFAIDIVQQLCWLTATFATPPPSNGSICYCTPRIELIRVPTPAKPIFRLETCFTELHVSERNSCWLSLFSNAAIAYGFPIPERADGMGLEMSVKLMAGIIGARHAATFDGGVVIKGFSSMFVPVMRTRDGIQWHYVTNSDPDTQLSYEEGVKQCSNRLLDLDFASLTTARCFIGWNSLVEVRVGDETNNFDNIEFSDAAEVKAALQIPGGSLGFQQFGLAQIDVTFGKRDGKCHFQRNSSYRRIVSAADKMFVALFDTGERRSCLVPASGLLLHILRHRLFSGLGGVPASKVKITSAGSFTETLLKNAKVRLTSEEDEPLFIDDVVSEIWSVLELLQAQSISAEKNSKLEIHATWQERLLGYEYKAVVEDWSPMPLKELEILKTCGGWPRLVRDVNALVLLANGFGDLIRPIDNQTGLCHQWKMLPRGKDYMAVPVQVLLGLYSLAGCRESKKRLTATNLALHSCGTPLFQPCPTPKEWQCPCDRLLQVVSISSFGHICVPDLIEGNSAVIIGESGSLLKRLTKRNAPKITGILGGHAKAVSDGETSLSCNSDTSNSSTGSESSDFRHSNTSSPASSAVDESEVSQKHLNIIGTGLFNFCRRGKRGFSETAGSISTAAIDPPRLVKQPCLGKLPCRENLLADGSGL
ncbi:hypothetical protein F5Y03DRAFT_148704 [Xylaria venustula]|nr:hypothetical protein F5Y03DRAFT_148704 [Xylaria venustula]